MSPCNWPISYANCKDMPTEPTEDEIEDQKRYEKIAAEYLWNWTGRKFGLCEVQLRPCRSNCAGNRSSTFFGKGPHAQASPWMPVMINGSWFNLRCGSCQQTSCSCSFTDSIVLPGPVHSIQQVLIDGEVLDPESYVVEGRSLLTRIDGGTWPNCQNVYAAPDQPDTFEVTYLKGLEVPLGGQEAAGTLADQLRKAACGDKSCQLPQRVQTVTRQGVSMTILDSFEELVQGKTGIWSVDSWVASITHPKRSGTVHSVDISRTPKGNVTWRSSTS